MIRLLKLSDILTNAEREKLNRAWATTKPADDYKPIPPGDYRCLLVKGELSKAKTGTVSYKLTFEVLEGEYLGRRVWHDLWLSHAALSMSMHDLKKLGIEQFDQLEQPLPEGIIVSARVVLHRDDKGGERNRLRRFDVVAVQPPTPDPFAPPDEEVPEGDDE